MLSRVVSLLHRHRSKDKPKHNHRSLFQSHVLDTLLLHQWLIASNPIHKADEESIKQNLRFKKNLFLYHYYCYETTLNKVLFRSKLFKGSAYSE